MVGPLLLFFVLMKFKNHLAQILAIVITGYVLESTFLHASIFICIHLRHNKLLLVVPLVKG